MHAFIIYIRLTLLSDFFLYQTSLKRTFQTGFWNKNYLFNLYYYYLSCFEFIQNFFINIRILKHSGVKIKFNLLILAQIKWIFHHLLLYLCRAAAIAFSISGCKQQTQVHLHWQPCQALVLLLCKHTNNSLAHLFVMRV